MELSTLVSESKIHPDLVTIEGTVDTGFESMALEECEEIFGSSVSKIKHRGKIYFNIETSVLSKVLEMRSIDNLYLIASVEVVDFDGKNKDDDLNKIKNIVHQVDLKKTLEIWKSFIGFTGITYPTREEFTKADEEKKKLLEKMKTVTDSENIKPNENKGSGDLANNVSSRPDKEVLEVLEGEEKLGIEEIEINDDTGKGTEETISEGGNKDLLTNILKFRATCNRVGTHSFGSMDAARDFGGQLQDNYNWLVDLKNFDLEVVLNIADQQGYVSVALTRESLHRRNIVHFGPTTLRATLCYNLMRLSQPSVGDIVVDPLCGGGSIPIEGALAFPQTYQICGDIHEKAVNRSHLNLTHLCRVNGTPLPIDLFHWDATRLPLKSGCVDVFTTDLPFGKRSGKRADNKPLYTRVLRELSRVVRPETGRAILLSHDKKTLTKVLFQFQLFWNQSRPFNVNLGGLDAAVFVLRRTAKIIV